MERDQDLTTEQAMAPGPFMELAMELDMALDMDIALDMALDTLAM